MHGCVQTRLVETMTGGGCHRRREMMGRGADGGCGTEEKPCSISKVSVKVPANEPANLEKQTPVGVDLFTQALKVLSERCPFDAEDANVSAIPTLPTGLANSLSKHCDGRKRQKKSHPGVDTKAKRAGSSEKARGSNFWAEMEEYFRALTVDDIGKLNQLSNFDFSGSAKYFSIPVPGNAFGNSAGDFAIATNVNIENENGVNSDSRTPVKERAKEEVGHPMEVDSIGANGLVQEDNFVPLSQQAPSCSGLEWLLCAKSKIYLTSERPSKKRKRLGGDAGLEKLLVASPVEGSSSLCHYCSLGDSGDQLNRLIVCSSCNVAVHQRCYGVQDDIVGSWLCSWCKQRNGIQSSERSCLLCPKPGGALKPVHRRDFVSENSVAGNFVHLFCCQWIPEVYVKDTRTMEPIMNVDGIKETRRKLVCYLCKVKCGACVRCSNGTCRTSFHPICAREARHRMEVWGKFGCDEVELRAFCSKHSECQNGSSSQQSGDLPLTAGSEPCITNHQSVTLTINRPHKLKLGRKNGDKIIIHLGTGSDISKLGGSLSSKHGLADAGSDSRTQSECSDAELPVKLEALERSKCKDQKSELQNIRMILTELTDQGKVNLKDVASETGIPPDSLDAFLADDCAVPDLHGKVVTWLKSHAYIGSLQKYQKVKIKYSISSKDEVESGAGSDDVAVSDSDTLGVVPVKSVPRRRNKNFRILKDKKIICPSEEMGTSERMEMDDVGDGTLLGGGADYSWKESNAYVKNAVEPGGGQNTLSSSSPTPEGGSVKSVNSSFNGSNQENEAPHLEQSMVAISDMENPIGSVAKNDISDLMKSIAVTSSFIHPLIHQEVMKTRTVLLNSWIYASDATGDQETSSKDASFSAGSNANHGMEQINSIDMVSEFDGANMEQLNKARNLGVSEMSPEDEVEGELIFQQHKLLCNAVARKHLTDNLIFKIVKSLSQEIDSVGMRKWDAVLVNQYFSELREARKQGRKERRHKEAQAILAAATAAAATSSRNSSFRKDALDESAQQEANVLKVDASSGSSGLYSQQQQRAKDTLSRLSVERVSLDRTSDQSTTDLTKEHPRICEICRRNETILNPVLVCSSCKVAVHLDCYRSVTNTAGPWYCELCEDLLSSRNSGVPAVNSWDKPCLAAECCLCGGTAGAFRKSIDGQWVHAFCAEWVLESTFRRGQANLIGRMDSILKGNDVCHICCCKQGVCIKCNYGHCRSMFHPSCARSAGFYMNVKAGGGKWQHKAYCERHTPDQRAKVESQKHGIEELKSVKQIRVELERLRLLCERIVKREKLKRELILCSEDILVSSRDSAALSALVHSPFFPADGSSESATTSLKGNTDDCRSGSEAIQRSDDTTVDSTVSGKRRIRFTLSMDHDQKTDDSSTSKHVFMQKPSDRVSFGGKHIPYRHSSVASPNLSDDGEKRSKRRKHAETFEKELIMTSDQASMKNRRLPKGFVYVPVQCLSNEEQSIRDAYFCKPLERDG